MISFLDELKNKSPKYSNRYRAIIERFAKNNARNSRERGSTADEKGKFFDNYYEIFMYATFLGLRTDNKIAFATNEERHSFIPIKDWKHTDLVNVILSCAIVKSEIDLNAIEDMKEESDINREILSVSKTIEEYANGGFEIIEKKMQEEPYLFEGDYCFVELLKTI